MDQTTKAVLSSRIVTFTILVLLLFTCQGCESTGGGLPVVARGQFSGEGVMATDLDNSVLVVQGSGEAGLYQVEADGQLRLTRPFGDVVDAVLVRNEETGLESETALGEPLPAWTEPVVRAVLTSDDIDDLGLTWSEEIDRTTLPVE